MRRALTLAMLAGMLAFGPAPANAGEEGTVRTDAEILLAHTARSLSLDPEAVSLENVAVSDDKASVSWRAGKERGSLTLERHDGRWFATCPAMGDITQTHWPIAAQGGSVQPPVSQTSCYSMTIGYSANDAQNGSQFSLVYGRAPTSAEFLPYPTTYPFVSNSVYYFDITVDGPKPITFAAGTRIEVWFPFVLDDRLRYVISVAFAENAIDGIYARPFDNTLQFVLPRFTALPGKTLMGEIDGDPH